MRTPTTFGQIKRQEATKRWIRKQFFTERGVPKCFLCGTEMKKAFDERAQRVTGYSWKLNCACAFADKRLENLRISIG